MPAVVPTLQHDWRNSCLAGDKRTYFTPCKWQRDKLKVFDDVIKQQLTTSRADSWLGLGFKELGFRV